jgi:hypothetical protein
VLESILRWDNICVGSQGEFWLCVPHCVIGAREYFEATAASVFAMRRVSIRELDLEYGELPDLCRAHDYNRL